MWLNLQMGYELEQVKITCGEQYDSIEALPGLSAVV